MGNPLGNVFGGLNTPLGNYQPTGLLQATGQWYIVTSNATTQTVFYEPQYLQGTTAATLGNWQTYYTYNELVEVERVPQREPEPPRITEDAPARALALLLGCLSDLQRAMFEQHGYFDVKAKSGRRYRLNRNAQPRRINAEGQALFTYCIHTYGVPREDELLGYKLMIECNEAEFLATANATATAVSLAHFGRVPPHPVPVHEQQEIAA